MRKLSFLLYLTILVITVSPISCTDKQDFAEQLSWAKEVIEKYPDSALVILNSIMVFDLNDRKINDYNLLYVKAKDRAYKDILSDTVIFQVKKNFLSKNDYDNSVLTTYYCGRILQRQNKNKESMNKYWDAEMYAKNSNINFNVLIQCNIGELFQKQILATNAIQHFLSAGINLKRPKILIYASIVKIIWINF